MELKINQTIAQNIGNEGEAMAADWLWLKGFEIVDKNWRSGHKEIDLVCKQDNQWVFVEVKTRQGMLQLKPEISVNYQKRKRLHSAAAAYLEKNNQMGSPRLDVIAISMLPWGKRMMYFKGK